MGVVLRVLKNVKHVACTPPSLDVWCEREEHANLYNLSTFSDHACDLEAIATHGVRYGTGDVVRYGCFTHDDHGDDTDRASTSRADRWSTSYTAYGVFREHLSKSVLGVAPDHLWNGNDENWRTRPFAWLINFSDCEGCISTTRCRKIADDFAVVEHREKFRASLPADRGWMLDAYDRLGEIFELAASTNGVVRFS